MSRLVVISNRVPDLSTGIGAGGLAAGLHQALSETGGLWFGWSGTLSDPSGSLNPPHKAGAYTLATMDLSAADHAGYYAEFANRALWPLLHSRVDMMAATEDAYGTYRRVNRLFAERVAPMIGPGDIVWVHDYHLIPLGDELRRAGVDNPIGFFLHIPVPPPEIFVALPWHRSLIEALGAYDLAGVQSSRDKDNLDHLFAEQGRPPSVATGVFPIGVDADGLAEAAAAAAQRPKYRSLQRRLADRTWLIGADRLDYSKGLPERLRAFERFLDRHPEQHGSVSLLQAAAPSRETVPEYVHIREEVEGLVGHINGRFGELGWQPVLYFGRALGRERLGALFRLCPVALVTPLMDGMNLVAKEYVAAQDPAAPGVLVLSRFAGAAESLDAALIVNPHDIDAMADAIHDALVMPQAERRLRWQRLITAVRRESIQAWSAGFLDRLSRQYRPAASVAS